MGDKTRRAKKPIPYFKPHREIIPRGDRETDSLRRTVYSGDGAVRDRGAIAMAIGSNVQRTSPDSEPGLVHLIKDVII